MPEPIRVSVSEAAKLFGISTRTVRRAITDGLLTYIVVQGRYKISFESLVKWSQQIPRVARKRDSAGIGQFVDTWGIRNKKYSPHAPTPLPTSPSHLSPPSPDDSRPADG